MCQPETKDDYKVLPLKLIHDPAIVLRPIDTTTIDYMEYRDSVRDSGFLGALVVRDHPRKPGHYELVVRRHLLHIAKELGHTEAPCIIKPVTNEQMIEMQIKENAIRVPTEDAQYRDHIRRLMKLNPNITQPELAVRIRKHPKWIHKQMCVAKMHPQIQWMVDRGEICMENAYMLAKLPDRFQKDFLDRACFMTTAKFKALVANFIKRYMEDVTLGKYREKYTTEFVPVAHYRGNKQVKEELESPKVGATIIVAEGCQTHLDVWQAALRWVLNLDKDGLKEQRRYHAKTERDRRVTKENVAKQDRSKPLLSSRFKGQTQCQPP